MKLSNVQINALSNKISREINNINIKTNKKENLVILEKYKEDIENTVSYICNLFLGDELMKITYINGNILNRGFSCGNINSIKEVVEKTYINKYSKQVIKISSERIREEIILNTIEIDNLDELTKRVMSKFITNE
jgi:hypothetical protein